MTSKSEDEFPVVKCLCIGKTDSRCARLRWAAENGVMTMGIAYDSSLVSDAPTPSDFSDLTSVLLVVLPCLVCYRGEMGCIVSSGPNRLYVRLPALLSSIFAWSRSSTDKKIKTIDRQRAIKQKAVYRLSSHIAWTHLGFYCIFLRYIIIQACTQCSQLT